MSYLSLPLIGGSIITLSQRLRRAVGSYAPDVFGTMGGPNYTMGGNNNSMGGDYFTHPSSSSSSFHNSPHGPHLLPQEMLRKYIEYARRYCHPRLTKAAAKVLQRLYLTMRAQSALGLCQVTSSYTNI